MDGSTLAVTLAVIHILRILLTGYLLVISMLRKN